MKVMNFLLLAAFCLLIIIGRPDKMFHKEQVSDEIQREEEVLTDDMEDDSSSIQITYSVPTSHEEPIADILWLKKAAKAAIKEGAAYFNVVEQNISRRYVKDEESYLSVISGEIQLDHDPMTAEYDAHAILDLYLTDSTF